MTYAIHDVVLYRFPLKNVNYPRPCIIVDIAPNGTLAILPISTKDYAGAEKFRVSKDMADFAATGLTDNSLIFGSPVLDIPSSWVIKRLGSLSGQLKKDFTDWIG
jgi:hypothetical protein